MKSAAIPTVFIVDDDRGLRQAIQDLVESVGLHAEAFSTGQDFLRKQLTGGPSCLVLDVRLPQLVDSISSATWRRPACKFPSSSLRPMATFLCLSRR
jgi:FixJ family two-component response regulator